MPVSWLYGYDFLAVCYQKMALLASLLIACEIRGGWPSRCVWLCLTRGFSQGNTFGLGKRLE